MFIELPQTPAPAADVSADAAEPHEGPQTLTAEPMPRRPRRGGEAASRMEVLVERGNQRWPTRASVDPDSGPELTFTTGL